MVATGEKCRAVDGYPRWPAPSSAMSPTLLGSMLSEQPSCKMRVPKILTKSFPEILTTCR
jgi:hypothetical protein